MASDYGIIGQICGPFDAGTNIVALIIQDVNSKGGNIGNPIFTKIGISIAEKDFMIFGKNKSSFKMVFTQEEGVSEEIWMGRTQIYESDEGMKIKSLTFPQGAPTSVRIEYVILDNK